MTTFILPLVYWRPHPAEDDVTCLFSHADSGVGIDTGSDYVVAGTERGHLWVMRYSAAASPCLIPQVVLVGHREQVTCVAVQRQDADVGAAGEEHVLVSASEDGEICLWNLSDGQCKQVNSDAFPGVPRALTSSVCGNFLFLGGQASQLVVLDSQTLELIAHTSDLNDWILQIDRLSRAETKTYLSVLTPTSVCQFVFDEESRTLTKLFCSPLGQTDEVIDASYLSMTSSQTQTAFIGRKSVLLYNWSIGKISLVGSIPVPKGEAEWVGGHFSGTTLTVWTRFGNMYVMDATAPLTAPPVKFTSKLQESGSVVFRNRIAISCCREAFEVRDLAAPPSADPALFSIRDFWLAAKDLQSDPVTVQALLGHSILRGTACGKLQLASFAHLFDSPKLEVQAHDGCVTTLFVHTVAVAAGGADGTGAVTRTTVVTGGEDGTVRTWTPDTLSALHVLRHHAAALVRITVAPHASPFPDALITLAEDNSIGVVRPSDGSLLLWIPNHAEIPTELAWRDDLVVVGYRHDHAHVWDTRAGTLDRSVHGETARHILAGCFPRVPLAATSPTEGVQKASLSLFTLDASHVFMINLKRLVTEGDASLARSLLAALLTRGLEPELDALAPEASPSRVTLGIRGTSGNLSLMAPQHREGLTISPTVTATRLLALFLVARALVLHADPARTDADVQVVFARYLAGLPGRVGEGFCFASLAFLARYWNDSLPALQLGARLVFQWTVAVMPADRIHEVVKYWASHLPSSGAAAAAAAGGGSAASSPGGTVVVSMPQVSAPATSASGVTKTMARATIILAVMECERPGLLPIAITKEVALSLTLLMADSGGASVGEQGESAGASGGVVGVYRISALELLGRGFAHWEPHVHGAAVVRTLVALGMQLPPSAAAVAAAAVQGHHHGHGHHHTNSSVSYAGYSQQPQKQQDYHKMPPVPPVPSSSAHPGAAVAAMARQALLAIATHNLPMVVQTVTTDLEHGQPLTNQSILAAVSAVASGNAGSLAGLSAVAAGSGTASHAASGLLPPSNASGAAGTGSAAVVAVDKATMLRFVSYLVHKLAAALATSGSAARLAEAVVAVLDPAHAVQRDVLLQPATATLFEMVRRFPVVAFHAAAQRLATGGTDGRVVVWDLRTATRLHVIDAHPRSVSVSAVAFTPDGRSVVSAALGDTAAAVKVWSPPSGLMYLVGAVAGGNSLKAVKAFAYTSPSGSSAASGWMVQLAVSEHTIELAEGGNRVQFQI
ncbi:hypothetical protein H9P43_002855 [Blastocladiella emersonii ATCC 22665]|nr:hypothetical protein H9P43_002855 [Blastocladiella emersonii ATCC 22665]